MLLRLAVTYYRPDFTEMQAKVLIADYLLDLAEFEPSDVETAISNYRRMPAAEYFPKPGILFRLSDGARTMRQAREKPTQAVRSQTRTSRPIMWWLLPRKVWKPEWREQDAPDGSMVRDIETDKFRRAYRFG